MSVLHQIRTDLRDFLARDERGELDEGQRRSLVTATIRDLQDFEVQLSNALTVIVQSAQKEREGGGHVAAEAQIQSAITSYGGS